MRILLHLCCGPCGLYPFRQLVSQGHEVCGFFYNPNIHPYQEFRRRLEALRQMAELLDYQVICIEEYGLRDYLRQVVFHEAQRCHLCYAMRLRHVAQTAAAKGFDAFTTSLLYSRYQNHQVIAELGQSLTQQQGIAFYYEDFRLGWQQGIDESIRLGLYRQPYCGCIYSEQERYDKTLRKKITKQAAMPKS